MKNREFRIIRAGKPAISLLAATSLTGYFTVPKYGDRERSIKYIDFWINPKEICDGSYWNNKLKKDKKHADDSWFKYKYRSPELKRQYRPVQPYEDARRH